MSIFDVFDNAHVYVCDVKRQNGYIGRGDSAEAETVLAEFDADIQPYSGGLAQKEYGLTVNCRSRMFSPPCPELSEGLRVKTGKRTFKILYTAPWEAGAVSLLEEI